MIDETLAKKLRGAVHAPLQVAFDALLEKGWRTDELMMFVGPEPHQYQIRIVKGRGGCTWDAPVFEVILTFDIFGPSPMVNIIERWLCSVPEPKR